MDLGLIKGRHDLPVEQYILTDEVNVYTKKEIKPMVVNGLRKLGIKPSTILYDYTDIYLGGKIVNPTVWEGEATTVNLYITGLTIVTLVAVEILNTWGYNVNIFGYNPEIKEYYCQGEFLRPSVF